MKKLFLSLLMTGIIAGAAMAQTQKGYENRSQRMGQKGEN